jgi:hypothetical protein
MDEKPMPAQNPFVEKAPIADSGGGLSPKPFTAESPAEAAPEKC